MTSQDRAKVFTVNIQDGATRNVIAFLELQSSLITCVQLNLSMITVHLNYAKRLLDILNLLSMSDGPIGRLQQVKRAN